MASKVKFLIIAAALCAASVRAQDKTGAPPVKEPPPAAAKPALPSYIAPSPAAQQQPAPSSIQMTPASAERVSGSSSPYQPGVGPEQVMPSTGPYQAGAAARPPEPEKRKTQPSAVPLSGIVLMPTAYRGTGLNSIGVGLDVNAAYYIGRIYGKNSYDWTQNKKNYLDRIGVWLLTLDGKMLVQTETKSRPAMAAGVQGIFTLRDSPQPKLDNPTVSVNVKNSQALGGAYIALTKRFHPRLITTVGYMEGTVANQLPLLSEFLSPGALQLNGHPDQEATSKNLAYGGFLWLLKPDYPIGAEIIIPQGAPMSPKLINFHLGTLLKMNFEVALLTFEGGWDILGMFQFRYNFYPR